jgi:hypothetical protein
LNGVQGAVLEHRERHTRKNVQTATPQVFVELAINVGGQRIARSRHRLGELGVTVLDGPVDTAIFKA